MTVLRPGSTSDIEEECSNVHAQGRTPAHQARNQQACEAIADAIVILLCIGAVGYLLALIFGWGQ